MSGSGRKRGITTMKSEPGNAAAAAASSSSSTSSPHRNQPHGSISRTTSHITPSTSSSSDSLVEAPQRFRVGAVVRVRMVNFMIYTEAEVFPGPGLNLLVGPNGSGKSTVVSAIGIALAGNTESVGRFGKLSEYIRGQEQKCIVEVELYRAHTDGRRNLVVARHFDRSGSENASKFFLGHDQKSLKSALKKDVEEEMKRLNIQVNNLCVYLAQFRVGEFAEMKEVKLLEETEKAADYKLYEQHVSLSEDVVSLKKKREAAVESEGNTQRLSKQVEDLAGEMKAQEERAETEKRIEIIKKRLPWCEYENAAKFTREREQEVAQREQELNAERAKHKPLERAIKEKEKQAQDSKKKEQSLHRAYQENRSKRADQDRIYEASCNELSGLQEELENLDARERKRIEDLKTEKSKLQQYMDQSSKFRTEEAMRKDRSALDDQTLALRSKDVSNRRQNDEFHQRMQEIDRAKQALLQKLHQVENKEVVNTSTKFRQSLSPQERLRLDEQEVTINLMKTNGKLKGRVFGPLIACLEVKDPHAAIYVEQVLTKNQRMTYVVENEHDLHLLLSTKKFNTVVLGGDYVAPKPIYDLRPFANRGIQFLSAFVECEDRIRAVLNDLYSFDKFVCSTRELATDDAESLISRKKNDGKFRNLFTPSQNYSTRACKYTEDLAVGTETMSKTAHVLGSTGQNDADVKIIADLTQRLNENKAQREAIEKERAEFMAQNNAEVQQREEAKRQINIKQDALQREFQEIRSMMSRIDACKQRIQQLERAVDTSKDRARIEAQKLLCGKKQEAAQIELQQLDDVFPAKASAYLCAQAENIRSESEFNYLRIQIDEILSSNSRLKAHVDAARRALVAAKQVEADRHRVARIKCDSMDYFAPHVDWLKRDISIDEAMALSNELDFSLSRSIGDPGIKDRFNRLSKQMRDANMRSQLDAAEVASLEAQIQRTKESWLEKIKQMVATIHAKFSEYFSRIGCRGVVELHEEEGKYGIVIKVSYRANLEPRPLSASTQSGGEKSVATMLYLLCLQDVTNSPFRMVDEINQGMDSKNEQTVFNQIVRACEPKKRDTSAAASNSQSAAAASARNSSMRDDGEEDGDENEYEAAQYFVVTPKLLPDLQYSRRVTVFNVYNGPTMLMPQNQWDVQKFIRLALSGELVQREKAHEAKRRKMEHEKLQAQLLQQQQESQMEHDD